jgi:putative transposase
MRPLVERGHPEISVRRQCELLGIEAVYPKPKLSQPGEGHRIYPYLLRGATVERVNQVWSTDITYIRMAQGWQSLACCRTAPPPGCPFPGWSR